MTRAEALRLKLQDEESKLLDQLRSLRRGQRGAGAAAHEPRLTVGQVVADKVAATVGSWPFIVVQTCILAGWITLNVTAYVRHWDPYPFILLNLTLSFQAAYAAPFIMMSQNRQQDIDRQQAASDYRINVKAELEIELLHEKIDALKEQELASLSKAVEELASTLAQPRRRRR